ncbi:MAG TPA: hypothetical protein VNQ90_15615 [Chthoniobacteraceae bacterium]|nr:hypothetical protein [Chthoniobacteraceae bacterium]
MADPEGVYNDGDIPYGSQIVTIGAQSYIASNISFEEGSNNVDSNNHVGVPRGQVLTATIPTGSAELQLQDSSQAPPARFSTFTLTDVGGGTQLVVISKVGRAWDAGGETKVSIDIRKVLNPPGNPET